MPNACPRTHAVSLGVLTLAAILSLAATSASRAIEITPPSPAPEHTLIVVDYGEGSCDVVRIVGNMPVNIATLDCNGKMGFCGPPGGYLIVSFADNKIALTAYEIGGGPGPGPPVPPPVPPVPPPIPPGPGPSKYGLAKIVYDLVMALPEAEKIHAPLIAMNYDIAADELEAKVNAKTVMRQRCVDGICAYEMVRPDSATLKNIYELCAAELVIKNQRITKGWRNPVGVPLAKAKNDLWKTNAEYRSPKGFADGWREVAEGLRAVR